MRSRLAFVVAGIAIVGGGGAAAARPMHSPTASEARPRIVSYLFKAEFGLGYEIEWTERSGSQTDDCAEWRIKRGTNEVNVGSVGTLPGRIQIVQRSARSGSILLQAVGKAKGVINRTLIQTGGSTWVPGCGGEAPPPFVPPANDCGGGAGRRYTIPNAALINAALRGTRTLDQLTEVTDPRSSNALSIAIAISAAPRSSPYRKCLTSAYAPEFPGYVKLRVSPADLVALRKLKPGHRRRIEKTWEGPCKNADEIPEEAACRFKLDLHVDIRRWRAGERFP